MRPPDLKSAHTFDWHDSPLDLLNDFRDDKHWKLLLYAYRIDFNEYDSGPVILSMTYYAKLLLTFFLVERVRTSHTDLSR